MNQKRVAFNSGATHCHLLTIALDTVGIAHRL